MRLGAGRGDAAKERRDTKEEGPGIRCTTLLGINHLDSGASVDGDVLAIDEVVALGAEKERSAGNVEGKAYATRGMEGVVEGT